MIVEGIRENGIEDGDKVVRSVMAQRQAQERRDLDNEYAARHQVIVNDKLAQLSAKYDKLEEDLAAKHRTQVATLQVPRPCLTLSVNGYSVSQ